MSTHSINGTAIDVRRAELSELIDLRHITLRGGLPRSEAIFGGDELPTSRHFGAFTPGASPVAIGCASLHLNQWLDEPAWQLRGMATSSDFRTSGLGRALLLFMEQDVLGDTAANQTLPRLLWCNARTPASRFYQRLGWQIVSEEFDIPTAGPHVRMVKRLG